MFALILEFLLCATAPRERTRGERFPLTTRLADGTVIVHGTIPGE